jgi:hypothetical protein
MSTNFTTVTETIIPITHFSSSESILVWDCNKKKGITDKRVLVMKHQLIQN